MPQLPMHRTDEISPPLCVAHIDSEVDHGGGEVQVLLLMEGLRRLGHRAVLLSPPASAASVAASRRGFEVVPVPMRNDLDFAAVTRLRRALPGLQAQLAHLHTSRANLLGGIAARRLGLPVVSTRRMDRRVRDSWKSRLIYGRLVDATIAVSPAVVACLRRGPVPPQRIHLIPEAVDPRRIAPSTPAATVRRSLGAVDGEVVLLVLAALVHRKGVDVLLEALAHLRVAGLRSWLWIAGDGEERDRLTAQCDRLELSDRVRFLGRRDDTADLLGACDVFVLPSRYEGLGVAALEAMAAGRPVVCSAVGGLAFSVIDGRTGVLVPPDDPAALAAALVPLVRDRGLRLRLGEAGPERIDEGFREEQMVAAHVALYRTLLAGRA